MKNLLIYINPERKFDDETSKTVKIQIDNSLDLEYKSEDIMLVTNFHYEYNNIKAIVVPDNLYCDWWKQVSKMNVIVYMFENNIIEDGQYWFHDLDAFQTEKINIDTELAFTNYGYIKKWNTGSFFFKFNAREILTTIRDYCYKLKTDEERAFMHLTEKNIDNINNKYEVLNYTYNFPGCKASEKYLNRLWKGVDKPIKVLHFHPQYRHGRYFKFLCGDNVLNISLMPERLIKIFRKYGYS